MTEPSTRSYQDLRDDLVNAAVGYELARREHEHATEECKRVRDSIDPNALIKNAHTLEVAMVLERKRREELAKAESAYKALAKTITAELEKRSVDRG
jgi:hypothetical protein